MQRKLLTGCLVTRKKVIGKSKGREKTEIHHINDSSFTIEKRNTLIWDKLPKTIVPNIKKYHRYQPPPSHAINQTIMHERKPKKNSFYHHTYARLALDELGLLETSWVWSQEIQRRWCSKDSKLKFGLIILIFNKTRGSEEGYSTLEVRAFVVTGRCGSMVRLEYFFGYGYKCVMFTQYTKH